MRVRSGVMAADFIPGPKIEAGIPHLLYTSNAQGGANPTRHLFDVSADGQRIFQRTQASIAGATPGGGGVPSAPPNFTNAAPATETAAPTGAPPNPSLAAANGLTVIRHWTTSVRKAAR